MIKIKTLVQQYTNNQITLEQVFELLERNDYSPSLVHNDNGHWAVTFNGMQELQDEPEDATMILVVEKDEWKPTVREAVIYMLEKL